MAFAACKAIINGCTVSLLDNLQGRIGTFEEVAPVWAKDEHYEAAIAIDNELAPHLERAIKAYDALNLRMATDYVEPVDDDGVQTHMHGHNDCCD